MYNKILDWMFESKPEHINPAIQRRVEHDHELRVVRMNPLVEYGREPTHREIWDEASSV